MKSFFITWGILIILCFKGYSQDQLLLSGKDIPAVDTVWIFTPESYDSKKSYPVVYMLHGYSGNYKQWDEIMNAQNYADEYDLIIVCPDGFFNSWYINSPKLENSQYSDFFFNKVIPEVESAYNINATNRFITGLSMGGYGAFHLFIHKPDMFRSAGSTSGVLDLRSSPTAYELPDHLGKMDENNHRWLSFSAIGNIDEFKEIGKELIFDCGTEDPFYDSNKLFYEKCLEKNIPVTFISRPGDHSWGYWKDAIQYHFEFFKNKME